MASLLAGPLRPVHGFENVLPTVPSVRPLLFLWRCRMRFWALSTPLGERPTRGASSRLV